MKQKIAHTLSTWFGLGLIPPCPGTWGSLAALPMAWIIVMFFGHSSLIIACLLVTILGLWSSEVYARSSANKDPSEVIIDEVAGQWIALLFLPLSLKAYLISFGFFRLFDILKPWPISFCDQKLKGGLGIMADDIVAGFAALLCSHLLLSYLF